MTNFVFTAASLGFRPFGCQRRRPRANPKWSPPRMSMLPSQFLEGTQLSPPLLRPGQDEPFLPSRAVFQLLWGKPRAESGECLSTSLPHSRPLCLKTKFTTDVAGSLLGARRCDIMARPTCPSRGLVRFVRGGNVERFELDYVRRTVAKVHRNGRRSSRKNKRQCDLGRYVHGEPNDRPKHDLFLCALGLGVKRILGEQEGMRLGRTPELVWRSRLEITEGRQDRSFNSSPENLRTGRSTALNSSWMVATQPTPWSCSRRSFGTRRGRVACGSPWRGLRFREGSEQLSLGTSASGRQSNST